MAGWHGVFMDTGPPQALMTVKICLEPLERAGSLVNLG